MKRVLYILAVFLTALLLVGGTLLAALADPRVETAAVRLCTEELSRGLGTEASVGRVAYRFPARLRITDLYMADPAGDTLAYIGEAYAHLRPLALLHHQMRFSRVDIRGVEADVHRLPDSTWNYAFLQRAFARTTPRDTTPFSAFLSIEDIRLDSFHLRYDEWEAMLHQARLDLHHLTADSLDAEIRSLSADVYRQGEHTRIDDLAARFIHRDSLLAFPTLTLEMPRSTIDLSGAELTLPTEGTSSPSFRLQVQQGTVCPADLAAVVPSLASLTTPVTLTGDLSGRLDSIEARSLSLRVPSRRLLLADLTVLGLPATDSLWLRARCQDLSVSAPVLEDLLSDYRDRPERLPAPLHRLGTIHYRGQLEGRLHHLQLHGAFLTDLGTLTTDGLFLTDSLFRSLTADATLSMRRFRIGRLLNHAPLGTVSMTLGGAVRVDSLGAHGHVRGNLPDLSYNGYTFRTLRLDGDIRPHQYTGVISVADSALQMRFEGSANLSRRDPALDFRLRMDRFRPEVLGLSDALQDSEGGGQLTVHLSGVDPDRMAGHLLLDSIRLRQGLDSVLMTNLTLRVDAQGRDKALHLTSDYLTAGATGSFRYADLLPALTRQAMRYLPSAFPTAMRQRIARRKADNCDIDFYVYGHQLAQLQRFFHLRRTRISSYPVLKGFFHESEGLFDVQLYAPGMKAAGTPIHDITVSLTNQEGPATLRVMAEALDMHSHIHMSAANDSLAIGVRVHQTDSAAHLYAGELSLLTRFSTYARQPLIDLSIQPSVLTLRDSLFVLSPSRLTYAVADTLLEVDGFSFASATQAIRANGIASPRATDSLRVQLSRIDAGALLPLVLDPVAIRLDGYVSGHATVYSVFSSPVFRAEAEVEQLAVNRTVLGNALATVDLDLPTRTLYYRGAVEGRQPDSTLTQVALDGQAEMNGSGVWSLHLAPTNVPLQLVNHWTTGILEHIVGVGSGEVDVFGRGGQTWVTARVLAQRAALTVPFTGCRYYLDADSVFLDSTAIRFPDMHLRDAEGHKLHLGGALRHQNFSNMTFDFDGQFLDLRVLDLPDKAGELLQGRVYATGTVGIHGSEEGVDIEAHAASAGQSRFRLSLDYASSAQESDFISFLPPPAGATVTVPVREEDEPDEVETDTAAVAWNRPSFPLRLVLNVEANRHLLCQLMLNERTGDMIQARGEGQLRFTYSSANDDMRLMGNYDLSEGSVGFTVGNLVRRNFLIQPGSSISFIGDVTNPQLDVTAAYRVSASLRDLFGSETERLNTTRTTIPVNTCLHMQGPLSNPVFRFSLDFPISEEAVKQEVRAIINTDEMLMRQVIYLLIFGKFFTPEYMNTASTGFGANESYALLSSTITGQINAWLGRLTSALTVGFNVRSDGEGASGSTEAEAAFTLQPVDRLLINGNLGYRYNDISNRPFFGDIDAEVLLTDDGQFRLRAYTHSVDRYSLRQAATIEGVGFVWQRDFNWTTRAERAQRDSLRRYVREQRAALRNEQKEKTQK